MFAEYSSYLKVLVCYLTVAAQAVYADESNIEKVVIGHFSSGSFSGWQEKEFKGQTRYQIVNIDGQEVLKAESKDAASGLFYDQRIDLRKTPFINWRWRIANSMGNINEKEKSGDDFAARIYAVKSGGLVFWNSKAVNYVWSSGTEKGKNWPNPFAGDHVMMTAVRSSADNIGTWYVEKRNLREDFKRLFEEDIEFIDALAIMTDTDNSHGQATAYYGDIYFSAE